MSRKQSIKGVQSGALSLPSNKSWCVVHFDAEAWSNLEESVVSRVVEPDPARRARDCLERMRSKHFWRSASAEQNDGEDDISLEQKLALFERYFALTYHEL